MKESTQPLEVPIKDVYNYLWSYGGQSSFFRELSEHGRFGAAKCPQCGKVWCPPRTLCSACLVPTEAITVGSEGEVVVSLTLSKAPRGLSHLKYPVAVALVKLDGSDTCIKASVVADPKHPEIKKGTRVRAQVKKRVNSIADFYFKPI